MQKRWVVKTEWDAENFDVQYYSKLLDKAWQEVSFAFSG